VVVDVDEDVVDAAGAAAGAAGAAAVVDAGVVDEDADAVDDDDDESDDDDDDDEYKSLYQPPPLRWNADSESSLVRVFSAPHLGQASGGGSLCFCSTSSREPHDEQRYSNSGIGRSRWAMQARTSTRWAPAPRRQAGSTAGATQRLGRCGIQALTRGPAPTRLGLNRALAGIRTSTAAAVTGAR
jgi:hypothetical protein